MMKNKLTRLKISPIVHRLLTAAALVWTTIFLSGCFGGHDNLVYEPRERAVVPPSFVAGATGVLFANSMGFSADLTVEPPMFTNKSQLVTGIFLGQGGHLLFAPKGSDRTFIWDVNEHSGWVLSEQLQGYAPISSIEQFTNTALLSGAVGASSERVNSHPGHEEQIAVTANNGAVSKFSIWRASDLNGLPVRVKVLDVNQLSTIQLSNVRRETLAAKIFSPPDGFTKYASADALSDEVFARKAKLRGNSTTTGDSIAPSRPQQSPTRGY